MATITQRQGYQSLDIRIIEMSVGEQVTVAFAAPINAKVPWDDGAATWTIAPAVSTADDFEVKVEHSLVPDGDYWVPDFNSPFDEASQGREEVRLERVRFTLAEGRRRRGGGGVRFGHERHGDHLMATGGFARRAGDASGGGSGGALLVAQLPDIADIEFPEDPEETQNRLHRGG